MASPANSVAAIPDTSLGLDNDDIQLLRRHQIAAAGGAGSSSSRAASRASSQGLLLLDGTSLAALTRHFDTLMRQIGERLDYLVDQSQAVATQQYDRAGNAIEMADAEMDRLRAINRQIDELEDDFDRIKHIKDIVSGYRQRVEEMERSLNSSSGRRERDSGHRHRHHESSGGGSSSRRHRR